MDLNIPSLVVTQHTAEQEAIVLHFWQDHRTRVVCSSVRSVRARAKRHRHQGLGRRQEAGLPTLWRGGAHPSNCRCTVLLRTSRLPRLPWKLISARPHTIPALEWSREKRGRKIANRSSANPSSCRRVHANTSLAASDAQSVVPSADQLIRHSPNTLTIDTEGRTVVVCPACSLCLASLASVCPTLQRPSFTVSLYAAAVSS